VALSPHVPPLHLGPIVPADPAALGRALAGVDRTPAPPDASYFVALGRAFREGFVQAFLRGAGRVHLSPRTFLAVALVAVGLALLLIVRALLPRRHRQPKARERMERSAPAPSSRPAALLDAAGWRAELESRLAGGQTAEALEAVWWWLARSLAGKGAEAGWTGRDLVARARLPGLDPLVRWLDRLTYGPGRPTPDDVRSLVGRLEEVLD
jgi:hypothetical protein